MPSSQPLDMEASLQLLSSNSQLSGNSLDEPVVLMVDPFLGYLNQVLMEEGEEDVACMQQEVEESYHAIMSSLYKIIGEHFPLDSTPSEDISSLDLSSSYVSSHDATIHENVSGTHSSHKSSHHVQQHPDIAESYIGHSSLTKRSYTKRSHPACDDFDVSLEKQKAETPCVGDINFRSDNVGTAKDEKQSLDLSLSDGKSAGKSTSIDVSFEELKDKAGYAALYVGKPSLSDTSSSTARASSSNGDKKKLSSATRKGSQSVGAEIVGFVDLREVLVSCAQAVAIGDVKRASEILQELYQVHGASMKGNALQRVAHYFCDALVARMGGMGGHQWRIMCENMPSTASILKASRLWLEVTPHVKIMHYFANQNILKAAEGALRLHILDYGLLYGMQWPCLINALADREGGPPLLVITGIESPKPGRNSMRRLEECGRWLAAYARTYSVPFQFNAIVTDKWEDIDPASLHLRENEVLVVNCMKCLRHLADLSVDDGLSMSPRQKLLTSMRTLNPHLLLAADANAACSSPFFVSRFREALYYYSALSDMYDTLGGGKPGWMFLERRFLCRDILNIVACEGAERVERPETYKQWDAHIKRAGFELLPMPSVVLLRSRSYVKQHHHKDIMVHEDANGWMLLGWKGRIMVAVSAWKPSVMK